MSQLNPDVETSVGYEAPVRVAQPAPSAISGVTGLFSAVIGDAASSRANSGPTTGERKDALQQRRLVGLEESLRKADAVEAQKGPEFANRYRNGVLRNYALDGGDLSDANTQRVISLTTGMEADFVGLSPEEVAMNDFRGSEDYASFIFVAKSRYPDATPDELEQFAIGQKARAESLDVAILDTEVDWVQGNKQGAFLESINIFRQANAGALTAIAETNGIISSEDMLGVQQEWLAKKAFLNRNRPNGLPDERWKPVQDQINLMDEQLEFLTGIAGTKGIEAKLLNDLSSSIWGAVEEGKIENLTGNALLSAVQNQPLGILTDFGVQDPTAIRDALIGLDRTSTSTTDDTGETVPTEEQYSQVGAEAKLADTKAIINSLGPVSNADEERRNSFVSDGLDKAFGAMASLGNKDKRFTSIATINKTFDGSVRKGIMDLGKSDPVRAKELAEKGYDALDAQRAVALDALSQMEARSVLTFDRTTGRPTITEESLGKLGWTPNNVLLMSRMADRYYGGDLVSLISDKGSRFASGKDQEEILARQLSRGSVFKGLQDNIRGMEKQGALVMRMGELATTFSDMANGYTDVPSVVSNGPIAQSLGLDFNNYEREYNLPTGYLERVAMIESAGNPGAKNEKSSAGGLFQQIDSNAAAYGVVDRFDPVQSTEGAARFARDNFKLLNGALGRHPEAWELYLAHQQGGGGALKLLTAAPGTLAKDLVGMDAVTLNGGTESMTAKEFAGIWARKYSGGRSSAYTGDGGTPPTTTTMVDPNRVAPNVPEELSTPELASAPVAAQSVTDTGTPALTGEIDMTPEDFRAQVKEALKGSGKPDTEPLDENVSNAIDTTLELLVKLGLVFANQEGNGK